ncbi:MAG TPA: DUF1349 domain-containing protein [Naasia sp.]|jgi:regulation of enolase protein 1 (concanavalin A-like superfamily)
MPDTGSARTIRWDEGTWTTPPLSVAEAGTELRVTAVEGSDAWRHTSYGFVHDTEHALLAPFPEQAAMEVEFLAEFPEQFDQAGIFVRVDDEHWVKAGVEFGDGVLQVGAVVTAGRSDWSVAPVPDWQGTRVTIRASRAGDALTIRARSGNEPFRLVRVVPLAPDAAATAGPMVCAPTRPGLTVAFSAWRVGPPDAALH